MVVVVAVGVKSEHISFISKNCRGAIFPNIYLCQVSQKATFTNSVHSLVCFEQALVVVLSISTQVLKELDYYSLDKYCLIFGRFYLFSKWMCLTLTPTVTLSKSLKKLNLKCNICKAVDF